MVLSALRQSLRSTNLMETAMIGLIFALAVTGADAEARSSCNSPHQQHHSSASSASVYDDTRDRDQLIRLVSDWRRAQSQGHVRAELAADAAIQSWLRREIVESERDVSLARAEVARSQRELEQERRDLRYDRSARAHREVADDQRDLNDDLNDLYRAEADLSQTRRILHQLESTQSRFSRRQVSHRDYAAKRSLLDQLVSMTHAEVSYAYAEQSEDRWDR
jgi:hypothetical protein